MKLVSTLSIATYFIFTAGVHSAPADIQGKSHGDNPLALVRRYTTDYISSTSTELNSLSHGSTYITETASQIKEPVATSNSGGYIVNPPGQDGYMTSFQSNFKSSIDPNYEGYTVDVSPGEEAYVTSVSTSDVTHPSQSNPKPIENPIITPPPPKIETINTDPGSKSNSESHVNSSGSSSEAQGDAPNLLHDLLWLWILLAILGGAIIIGVIIWLVR
ncbi:hypothetical protein DSO57_1012361 [Entomophthora muscae]|uniref:Uncharacterized protein n=1 Tax=Entomophthora muscae TaxID=34485 RepID=A0ACC2THE9_9FUNG|nr:hypothetical protein DSO57_1012361 [Entomophthora muscae]